MTWGRSLRLAQCILSRHISQSLEHVPRTFPGRVESGVKMPPGVDQWFVIAYFLNFTLLQNPLFDRPRGAVLGHQWAMMIKITEFQKSDPASHSHLNRPFQTHNRRLDVASSEPRYRVSLVPVQSTEPLTLTTRQSHAALLPQWLRSLEGRAFAKSSSLGNPSRLGRFLPSSGSGVTHNTKIVPERAIWDIHFLVHNS
jgi:hypothetical protein